MSCEISQKNIDININQFFIEMGGRTKKKKK